MINGWKAAVKRARYIMEYGCYSNDLSNHDIADELAFLMDQLAKENGEPEIDWEEEIEWEAGDET